MIKIPELNPEQKLAVAFGDGPLRIMAGAGTGKTFTLTRRISSLVENGFARPSQILALTFTNKAAGEMRDRIDKAVAEIPSAGGEQVDIDTYHAFGGRIVAEHAHLLGLPPEPLILTPAEAWILLWRSLDEIDFRHIELLHLRGTGNAKSPLLEMLNLGSRLRDELASLDDLENHLAGEEATDPKLKLGDFLRSLRVYERRKKEIGAIDYGDQIALACELLARSDVAGLYHQRYRYLLVDEFQDTNYAQSVMVRRLAESPTGNVCVVGDPNQAIYAFRGASPDNLDRFAETEFPSAQTLALTQNFRSTPDILAVANAVWGDDRDPFRGNLEAANPSPGLRPTIVDCETPDDEIAHIANEIARLVASGRKYKEIAVIARKNKIKEQMYQGLRDRRIPCEVIGGASLYGTPEVRELISYLRTIGDPRDDLSLAHILFAEQWGLDERSLYELARTRDRNESLLTAVRRIAELPNISSGLNRPLAAIERLIEESYRVSLGRLVEEIVALRKGGYDEIEQINVQRFITVVRAFAESRIEHPQLADLLAYLDLLLTANPDEEAATGVESDDADTVKIMTSHASKGLEWEVVFVCGANKHDFKTSNRQDILPAAVAHAAIGHPDPLSYPNDPKGSRAYEKDVAAWKRNQHELEELRVLYVALTRAQQELTISWARTSPSRKNDSTLLPALESVVEHCHRIKAEPGLPAAERIPLFREIVPPMFEAIHPLLNSVQHREPLVEALGWRWQRAGGTPIALNKAIDSFLRERESTREQISVIRAIEARNASSDVAEDDLHPGTSYTQLETYKRCPHQYYLRHVVRLPIPPAQQTTVTGTAFHDAIQREAEFRKNGTSVDPGTIRSWFESNPDLIKSRAAIPTGVVASSTEDLIASYSNSIDFKSTPLLVEARFALRLGELTLHGAIDRVHRLPDGTTEVIDYKTDRRVRTEEEVRDGWQLPIYLLACRDVFPEIQPIPTRGSLFFVRANERITVEYTSEQLAEKRAEIEEAGASLRRITPDQHSASEDTCRQCSFRQICKFAIFTRT